MLCFAATSQWHDIEDSCNIKPVVDWDKKVITGSVSLPAAVFFTCCGTESVGDCYSSDELQTRPGHVPEGQYNARTCTILVRASHLISCVSDGCWARCPVAYLIQCGLWLPYYSQ